MAKKAVTSVIIPFFNNRATVSLTINSLLDCEPPPDEIILVDDGSTDNGAQTMENLPVKIISSKHVGRPAALNLGIKKAKGDILLFTDADCVAPKNWVGKLVNLFLTGQYSGVGGNLMPSIYNVAEVAKVLRYIHEFERDYVLNGHYTRFCLNGNNMAILKEAMVSVGNFNESYFHGADADLTRRLLKNGHKLLRVKDINTTHLKVDSPLSFLKTSFKRGSTIIFSKKERDFSLGIIFPMFILSPGKYFIKDVLAIKKLSLFDKKKSWWLLGIGAAFLNFAGAYFNGAGQIYYLKRLTEKKGG